MVSKCASTALLAASLAGLLSGQTTKRPARKAAPKAAPARPAADPKKFTLRSIRITGLKLRDLATVIKVAGLEVEKMVEPADFETARNRLLASGAFSSIAYSYGPIPPSSYEVTFEVVEFDQLYPYKFDGLPVPAAEIEAHLRTRFPLFSDKIPGTDDVLKQFASEIEALLTSKGAPEKVVARMTADRPGELFVLFRKPGVTTAVAEVHFRGNQVVPTSLLQNTIHGVAIGVEYREDRFRELLARNVSTLYEARGRVRVKYPTIETVPAKDVKGLAVTVTVEEGPSYSWGDLRVSGTGKLDAELLKATPLKSGDVANYDLLKPSDEAIRRVLRRGGYLKPAIELRKDITDDKKEVAVEFEVSLGPQYTFGQLRVQGLDIHGESEVKRLWGLGAGKPFNGDYPDFFLAKIREENIFDNLGKPRAVVTTNDGALTADVTLVFR